VLTKPLLHGTCVRVHYFYLLEGTDTGWRALLEKQGLHQATDIFEKYGTNSETDLSELEQDDFSDLISANLC
jgi:hypothetical protein